MNCTSTWITMSALISTSRFNKQQSAEQTPMNTRENVGNLPVGCNWENGRKNLPSTAAANGTREYPSSKANSEAKVVQSISSVANCAALKPYKRSIKVETMEVDCMASRHGTTPMMVMFIVR